MEASSHNPDIILLDLGLPDIDGVEVIHKVRSWSNLPIIVISARSEDTDKIEALDAGADDYLTKPIFSGRTTGTASRDTKTISRDFRSGAAKYRSSIYKREAESGLCG